MSMSEEEYNRLNSFYEDMQKNWPFSFGKIPKNRYHGQPAKTQNENNEYLQWHHVISKWFCEEKVRRGDLERIDINAIENGRLVTQEQHIIIHQYIYDNTNHIFEKKAVELAKGFGKWDSEDEREFLAECGRISKGTTGLKHKSETLEILSELNSGENNPNFGGVCQTTEVRKDMSEKKIGKKNNRYGCSWWTNGVVDISCFEHELDKKLEAIGYSSREGWTKGHRAKPFG